MDSSHRQAPRWEELLKYRIRIPTYKTPFPPTKAWPPPLGLSSAHAPYVLENEYEPPSGLLGTLADAPVYVLTSCNPFGDNLLMRLFPAAVGARSLSATSSATSTHR